MVQRNSILHYNSLAQKNSHKKSELSTFLKKKKFNQNIHLPFIHMKDKVH